MAFDANHVLGASLRTHYHYVVVVGMPMKNLLEPECLHVPSKNLDSKTSLLQYFWARSIVRGM